MKLILQSALILATLLQAAPIPADDRLVVLLPPDQRRLGVADDPRCEPEPEPCFRITAEGTVPPDLVAYFAVEPLDDPASVMWLTPIASVNSDGAVREVIQFGEAENGAKKEFVIRLLGCHDPNTLKGKHTITSIPPDCISSDFATLYRVR